MRHRAPGRLLATLALLAGPAPTLAAGADEVVLRGEAVCLDEGGAPTAAGAECPDEPAGGWALRTADGELHRLSNTDPRVAILVDARVRSKELQITAWRDEEGGLAIVHLRTLIDGRVHDPHYWCSVCSIRSNAPGPCWCCRAPFELREPPLEGEAAEPQGP